MLLTKETIRPNIKTSLWIIAGATAILVGVVLVLAVQNIQREKRHMAQVLSNKGDALIRAIEAGTRTGMMGHRWGGRQVQRLLEETSHLPDVNYVALIKPDGTVMAHSDSSQVGKPFHTEDTTIKVGFDFQEKHERLTIYAGTRIFEVYRHFQPIRHPHPRHRPHMNHRMKRHGRNMHPPNKDWFDPQKPHSLVIVAGFDVTPLEKAIERQVRHTILLSVMLLLLGIAGFVSLFWMQSYRAVRRSLNDTSLFANKVVSHLPVGLIATDSHGRIVFFNAAAQEISSVTQEAAIGKLPDKVLPPGICRLNKVIERGENIHEQEIICDFGNSTHVPISVSATRIINELNQLVGHVVIIRDLREVRGLQEQIKRQEKLAALGGMAAGVAHEIRNPLSSIKGMATYLADQLGPENQNRKAATVMVQEVDRLNRVISELLEFARPSDVSPQATDLKELLQHSVQLIQQDAAAKKVQVKLDISNHLCHPLIDPDRFSQCLLNLYLNAIAAMPHGGQLKIVCNQMTPEDIKLEISDTGKGIPQKHLTEIFNPYFTTKPTGTGLGLAIVHKIVDAHKGHIEVHSTSKGTAFTIHLPCNNRGADGNKC